MFAREGFFRFRDLMEDVSNQAVHMRDLVITDPRYEQPWQVFNVLRSPNFLEVAQGKKQKKKHREIAEKLDISKHRVDEISKYLIEVGAIQVSPLGRANARRFRELVILVEREDQVRNESGFRQTEEELARKLSVPISTIRRARRRIRIKNQEKPLSPRFAKKPNYEEVKMRRERVLEGLRRDLTNRQVSVEYRIPPVNVKEDRRWLREKKEIPTVTGSREANKELMRQILNEHLQNNPPGTIINLKAIQRSGAIPVSYSEHWNLYNAVAEEQEVPPVRSVSRLVKSKQ